MDIKDSYLHGTVGVVKSISVDADKLKYKLADIDGTVKEVTLPSMVAATSDTDGKPGLVPTPSANSLDKYLKGDGTWSDITTLSGLTVQDLRSFVFNDGAYINNKSVVRTIPKGTDIDTLLGEGNCGFWSSIDNENYDNAPVTNFGLMVNRINGSYFSQMIFGYKSGHLYYRSQVYNTAGGPKIWSAWKKIPFFSDTIKTTYDTDKGVKVELSGTFDEPKIDVTTTFGKVTLSNSSNAVSGETIAKSVPLLIGKNGTEILANSDLNSVDFCVVGTYSCISDANAKTLKNCPATQAFAMFVSAPGYNTPASSPWAYFTRRIVTFSGMEWIQHVYSSVANAPVFEKWYRILREDTTFTQATTSTVNGTQVVNAGTGGAVPAPQTIEDNSKFLKGDGTWAIPSVSGKVSNDLILKINSGTTEGTSLYTYNGSAAKTLDIKNGTGIGFTNTAGVLSIYNSGVRSISTGSANGTISVNTNGSSANVAVKGLDSAAYTNTSLYQKQSTYVNNTREVDVYKKITITKSDLDGYGVWLHSRKQHYLLNSGAAAMSTPMNTFWELGTAYNASSGTRIISVKMIAPASSSNITLYVLVRAYTYIQVVTSGTVTISDSTSAEYEGITSSTTGWVACLSAQWTDTTYSVVSNSANGLAPKVINTNTTTVGTAYYVLASSDGSATPSWYKLPTTAFANDDTKVTQTNTTGSADYRVLFSGNANDTTETTTARKSANLKFNPNTGNLSTGTLLITKTTNAKHILFSRGSDTDYPYNYIAAPTGGKICILPNGVSNESSLGMHFDDTGLHPATTQAYSLGTSSYRWSSVYAKTLIGNLDGTYVNKLTGYTKATTKEAIAATDTLNVALGKLEFKADAAYDLVKGAYDGDGTIENLAEILKVLEGIKDTETILAIIGKYLPLTGGTLTGALTIQKSSFGSLIIYRKDNPNSASIQFKNGDNVSLGYIGMNTADKCLYRFSANSESSYTIWDSGNDGSGSGLDADLLDGVHASGLLTALSSDKTTNLSITVGGTTKSITDLYARRLGLSSNTITSTTDDTTAKWGPLGTSVHFYGTKDQLTDQPLLYGLLLNVSNTSSEVHQIWMTQASGNLYHRGGNSAGWSGTWRTILDSVNTHIKSGVITINGTTITPLTQHQSLANYVTLDTALTITGHKTFSGEITLNCGLNINSTNPITWNDNAYHQRIQTTDDSTTNTAVFTFQQSTDTGSTWTNLFTIKDNGHVIADKFITSGGTSSQFVKGDGSLDSTSYMKVGTSGRDTAYYRTHNVNGEGWGFFAHTAALGFTIYAPTTAGTKDLVLTSNGSGAPVWSELANITAGSLKPTVILASGSSTFKYVKFASINLTLRYSGKYAVLKLAQYFTTSTNYANSCDVHVHCYQLDEMGVAPEYTIQTNNDNNYFEIIGIVNYSTTNSTLDLYVYGKKSTYKSINVTTIIGENIISIGSNIDSLPTGTIVIPTKMGHVAAANNGIFYIEGTGSTAGTWLGSHAGVTSYYVGLTIAYKIPIAGASTTTLNINSLGAKTCYINTSKLTTHYGVGSVAILVYDGTYFRTADYDSTTTKVRLYLDTSAKEYPLAFRYDNTAANSSGYVNEYLRYASTITVNPSTSTITAATFNGTATLVACTATTDNVTRPIVLTNTSSKLYYTTKATINYNTGNITAPTFTGSLVGNADTSSKLNMTSITSYDGLTPIGVYGYTNTNSSTDSNDFPHANSSSAIAWGKDNCKVIIAARAGKTNADVYIRLYYTSWGNWYKLWNEGNDGADSGLDADLLDGTHKADLFTSLTNVNTKENPYSLSATIGGTTKFLQVNSFSLAALDIRDTTPTPNDVSDKSVTAWFNNKDTPGGTYWYSGITVAGWNNNYGVWLLASNSDQSDTETSLHFRTGRVDTWGAWKKVLDSSNYTSYTVKKDGTGASGTWEISITGNAATATTASKVTCTEASSNKDRPIVCTNMSNLLYYTTKATINWSTGNITVGSVTTSTIKSDNTILYLRYNNDNANSVCLMNSAFIPTDGSNNKINLGKSSNRWKSLYTSKLEIDSTGKILPIDTNSRSAGVYGVYDSTKVGHVWSIGSDYKISDDGLSTGNMYGLVYFHTNWSNNSAYNTATREDKLITEVSGYAGGHQIAMVSNGGIMSSLGNHVWSRHGFIKLGSSDSYVLLGGGGHKTISSLSVASAVTADYLKPTKIVSGVKFNLSNASWTDTGYTFASLTTGTYAVQVTSGSNLVASGIMSVYTNLSDTAGDEIPLHVYGTAGWRPYLRTYNNKLLISSNDISETSRTVTIKIALIL